MLRATDVRAHPSARSCYNAFMGIAEHTVTRTTALSITGLACLWPSLHASPYYPLPLTAAFATSSVADISAHHIVYSLLLICIFAAIIAAQKHVRTFLAHMRTIALAGGVAGCAGSVLLIASGSLGMANAPVIGIGFMLVAFYVAALVVAWLTFVSQQSAKDIVVQLALSYCLFSALWLIVLPLGIDAAYVLAVCPAVSAACLSLLPADVRDPVSHKASSLKALPQGVIALCVIFVYFGVICVRALTTMQQGAHATGGLSLAHHAITATVSLLVCLCIALYYRRKDFTLNSLITVFAFLALIYMAALLLVMVGSASETLTMLGKRTLVAAEHCLEVFVAIIAACAVSKKRLSPLLVFGLYAIVILVIPQTISLDLMYQSGLLDALAHMDLILPLAAATSFIVAAISIGLLTAYASRMARSAVEQRGDWQEELCRKATETIEASPREFDVIVLTYRGYSARKIAETLLVSESTVKTHISHAYRKLDIHSKQELIALVDSYRDDTLA